MALFHFHADILSRKKGHSACSAAAYRAGEEIHSDYSGETYDYRRKQYVEYSVVMLPDNAPAEFIDRATLWNSIESNERQANSQLARSMDIALPRELSFEDRKAMVMEFVKEQFVSQGMCADVCFHNPPMKNSRGQPIDINGNVTHDPEEYVFSNPHVHIMLSLRSIDESGKWEAKVQKLYVCVKNGEERLFSPAELKQVEGWEKVYNYTDANGHKQWLTRSYVAEHPECGFKLVNKYPKSIHQENPKISIWNSPETYVGWREAWAEKVNVTLKLHGIDEEVSHLSYKDQGLDIIPTVHEGKEITIAEKRLKEEYERKISAGKEAVLKHTEIRNLNLAIKDHNEELKILYNLQKLKTQMSKIIKPVVDRIETIGVSVAESLEHLRCQIIITGTKIKDMLSIKYNAEEKIKFSKEYIDILKPMRTNRIQELETQLEEYKESYDDLSQFHKQKKIVLYEKIKIIEEELSIQKENRKYADDTEKEMTDILKEINSLDNNIEEMKQGQIIRIEKYESIMKRFQTEYMDTITVRRAEIRPEIEEQYVSEIGVRRFRQEAQLFDKGKVEDPKMKMNIRMS